jgi:hypothetical protein
MAITATGAAGQAKKSRSGSVEVDGQRVPLTREGVLRKTGVGAALVESVKREIREQGKHDYC